VLGVGGVLAGDIGEAGNDGLLLGIMPADAVAVGVVITVFESFPVESSLEQDRVRDRSKRAQSCFMCIRKGSARGGQLDGSGLRALTLAFRAS
jgi:hypothetical protein